MRERHNPGQSDGYYFRDASGTLHGPLTRFQYEAWSLRGAIAPGTRVWRQQAGMTYKIAITRRFRWRKLCSTSALGALTEWFVVFLTFAALFFMASIPKLRYELEKELSGHVAQTLFFVSLVVVTVVMTLATMRALFGRVADSTTEVCESEEV